MKIACIYISIINSRCFDTAEDMYKKNEMLKVCLQLLLFLIFTTGPIYAASDDRQSLDDIMASAKSFIENNLGLDPESTKVKIKSLDNRLKLHACTIPLSASWPPGAQKSAHTSVGVQCNDHKPWKIYIGAHIQIFSDVWVTTTPLSRGMIIKADHVAIERRDMSNRFSEYMRHQQSPLGLVTKRALRAGDVITQSALVKQIAIKRGQKVQIIAKKNGLEIRSNAVAVTNGAMGERIRVRNSSTKKEMEGVLTENNTVLVNI